MSDCVENTLAIVDILAGRRPGLKVGANQAGPLGDIIMNAAWFDVSAAIRTLPDTVPDAFPAVGRDATGPGGARVNAAYFYAEGGCAVVVVSHTATIVAMLLTTAEGLEIHTSRLTAAGMQHDPWMTIEDAQQWYHIGQALAAHIASTRDQLVRRPSASTFGERRAFQRLGIKAPPPFYVVPVQQRVAVVPPPAPRNDAPNTPEPIDWSHRWDVRGHERVHVKRGSLPMDATDERVMALRGWRIYAHGAPIPERDAWRLSVRDFNPPAPGEWVALHSAWVKPHVKGPDDKPYVPALRVVAEAK